MSNLTRMPHSVLTTRGAFVVALLAIASPAMAQSGYGGGNAPPGSAPPARGMESGSQSGGASGTSGASGSTSLPGVSAPGNIPGNDSTGASGKMICEPANSPASAACGPEGVGGTAQSKGTTPSGGSSADE